MSPSARAANFPTIIKLIALVMKYLLNKLKIGHD